MGTHRELISAPDGMPDAGCVRPVEELRPADGQVLARTHLLSIDRYQVAASAPGATAMVGPVGIANIKAAETVAVSAAAGAVGSAVGQIARI